MAFRLMITGGAGFVGSSLALAFRRDHADWAIIAFDNLKRRGSELAIERLRAAGVAFQHGDVRCAEDLEAAGPVDLLIECSAEPSVHAGYQDGAGYLIATNLGGTVNCLEHLRRQGGDLIFLSTSRVYPISGLRAVPLERRGDRLALPEGAAGNGWSAAAGISEAFPLAGHRSLYGATKLASELLIEEYRQMYGLRAVVNRCGVLAGPWQMGKVDQGFIVLWMARHLYGGALSYTGFGGEGLQVRDILHIDDLYDVLKLQWHELDRHSGTIYNVAGGTEHSLSLRELTQWCQRLTGHFLQIGQIAETRPADVPFFVGDSRSVQAATGWRPRRKLEQLFDDVHRWLVDERARVQPILGTE
jgi:CDP-paratose 2-epimerase